MSNLLHEPDIIQPNYNLDREAKSRLNQQALVKQEKEDKHMTQMYFIQRNKF